MVFVFDFDGTLAETWPDIATALNRALEERALPAVSPEAVRQGIGHGIEALVQSVLPASEAARDQVQQLTARFRTHYVDCLFEQTRLYQGIDACLEAVRATPMALASNKPERYLRPLVEHLGLNPFFGLVLGGDSLAAPKPDPVVLRSVADHYDAEPGTLWMIGDTPADIGAAKSVGARSIGCGWGYRGLATLQAAGADVLVDTPDELLHVLRDIING